jgi:hypothetical protein
MPLSLSGLNEVFNLLRYFPMMLGLLACQVSLGQGERQAQSLFASCGESPGAGGQFVIIDSLLNPVQASSAGLLSGEAEVYLLAYVNTSCSACVLYLGQWKQLVDSLRACHSFAFRIIAGEKSVPSVTFSVEEADFDYPVFFDRGRSFYERNQLSNDLACHAFLVDRKGHVLVSGSPLVSPELLSAYLRHFDAVEGGCD